MTKPAVTLITPTGERPEAFELCEKYIKRQTYRGEMQWIVVDDGSTPTKCTMGQTYIRGPKLWRPGINTQRPNMDEALNHVEGDFIFIIEDDDWYAPTYIEKYMQLLQLFPVVGEGNAKYINILERSWREWSNYKHASLCQTALRRELLPRLEEAINSGELFIDCVLWRILFAHKLRPFIFFNQDYCVGIKGLPGRRGIGSGHFPREAGFKSDPGFSELKMLIGEEDTKAYMKIAAQQIVVK